ncbi:hypothetical protein FHX42_001697 [Saccharopolyspora lacisalsi]|uniref:Uncharacterized protein n=1 Tax=Halosaccharopolyspora lacisalsi TaxID=1000566 RepID=A0A839DTV0_9PSEU|nr:hypothetical protein [Halosaccharopolyspora lacisalsi]
MGTPHHCPPRLPRPGDHPRLLASTPPTPNLSGVLRVLIKLRSAARVSGPRGVGANKDASSIGWLCGFNGRRVFWSGTQSSCRMALLWPRALPPALIRVQPFSFGVNDRDRRYRCCLLAAAWARSAHSGWSGDHRNPVSALRQSRRPLAPVSLQVGPVDHVQADRARSAPGYGKDR